MQSSRIPNTFFQIGRFTRRRIANPQWPAISQELCVLFGRREFAFVSCWGGCFQSTVRTCPHAQATMGAIKAAGSTTEFKSPVTCLQCPSVPDFIMVLWAQNSIDATGPLALRLRRSYPLYNGWAQSVLSDFYSALDLTCTRTFAVPRPGRDVCLQISCGSVKLCLLFLAQCSCFGRGFLGCCRGPNGSTG